MRPTVLTAFLLPGAAGVPLDSRTQRFLISSFPDLKEVAYLMLPEVVWRPLVGREVSELVSPKAVVADNENQRLYVADPPAERIYWYNVVTMSDGRLETDEVQHIAVQNVSANSMAVDTVGNLYFSGKITKEAPEVAYDSIYRLDAVQIATGNAGTATEVWTRSNTGQPNPGIWLPTGVAVDAFSVYWGNGESGASHGTVVRGSGQSRAASTKLTVTPMADNTDQVMDLVMTPQSVFYATPDGIFALAKDKSEGACDADGVKCPSISTDAEDVQGMTYDGDGTVYLADNSLGAVYSFPSGSRAAHKLTKVADAPGTWGVAFLSYDSKFHAGGRRAQGGLLALLGLLAAARARP